MSPHRVRSLEEGLPGPSATSVFILPNDGAVLDIGPAGLRMIVQFSQIHDSEVEALRRGKLEVGVLSSKASGFLVLRFGALSSGKPPIVLDMPFHIGLLPRHLRSLPRRENGLVYALMIQIQDENGRQHGGRLVSLSLEVCQTIENLVDKQTKEALSPGWSKAQHVREIEDFQKRFPDVAGCADKLFARAYAHQTVQ